MAVPVLEDSHRGLMCGGMGVRDAATKQETERTLRCRLRPGTWIIREASGERRLGHGLAEG